MNSLLHVSKAIFDNNKTGIIPLARMRHVLSYQGETLTDDELNTWLSVTDKDGDGNITYQGQRVEVKTSMYIYIYYTFNRWNIKHI